MLPTDNYCGDSARPLQRRSNSDHQSSGAFTLIELLAVIAVIGILTAILIPVIGSARLSANRVTCASNLRSLGNAQMLFANDNNNQIPAWQTDLIAGDTSTNPEKFFFWLLLPYLTDTEGSSPLSNMPQFINHASATYNSMPSPGVSPELAYTILSGSESEFKVYYAVNKALDQSDFRGLGGNGLRRPTRTTDIQNPAKKVYLAVGYASFTAAAGQNPDYTLPQDRAEAASAANRIYFPYKGETNLLFLDGHVEGRKAPLDPEILVPWD